MHILSFSNVWCSTRVWGHWLCFSRPTGIFMLALTFTTLAVKPAALEDLPEVYTARGRNEATYLRIWDLPQEGSPTMATLMSPRSMIPCMPKNREQHNHRSQCSSQLYLFCLLMHSTKQHEQHSALDIIVPIYLRCNALRQVSVNLCIGLHLIKFCLLILCIVIVHFFWCFILRRSDVSCSTSLIC